MSKTTSVDLPDDSMVEVTQNSTSNIPAQKFRWKKPLSAIIRFIMSFWRTLTSMRVALVLLFLLAIAAIPGAFFPQHQLNEVKTQKYIASHGKLGVILDKLQLFSVFSSYWFTAIYALLFISLIGCIIPRTITLLKNWRSPLAPVPKNLIRLPQYASYQVHEYDATTLEHYITKHLSGWRMMVRPVKSIERAGIEISAEKGYFRDLGNIIFHCALLALLICIAIGKLYSYSGIRLITAGDDMCTTTPSSFDSFQAGNMIDGTNLTPLCIAIDDFHAQFLPNSQAEQFTSHIRYQSGKDLLDSHWKKYTLRVNHPLRVAGLRVYLQGHGYSPTITVTFPNHVARTQTAEFQAENIDMLSEGAMRFDPPAGMFPAENIRRQHQIAIEGLFAPTAEWAGKLLFSGFPAAHNPALAIDIYQGDTGLDTGRPQNFYSLDRAFIASGRLHKIARINLFLHQSTTLPNGIKITFSGYKQWIAMQIAHDPTQDLVLIAALCMVGGLFASIMVRRKRLWLRIVSQDDGLFIECAGLTKTDSVGWDKAFIAITHKILPPETQLNSADE